MASITVLNLEQIRIASPCDASWADMEGDEQVRFCRLCKLHVYNLSAMTRNEAETLIAEKNGRLCAQLYRRPDGTVITQDCPIGLRRLRRGAARLMGLAAVMLLMMLESVGLFGASRSTQDRHVRARQLEPFATACAWLNPMPPPPAAWLGAPPLTACQIEDLRSLGYTGHEDD